MPNMLWLAGLMGVLAACAFAFLVYLVFRRPKMEAEDSFDTFDSLDVKLEARNPVEGATLAASAVSSIPKAVPLEPCNLEPADTGPDTALDRLSEMEFGDEEHDDFDPDWLAKGGRPTFDEFDPQEDDLVLVWDDSAGVAPDVRVARNADDPALRHVLMGDVIVAQFRTKADVDHDRVSIVPMSAARRLGWAQA